MEGCNVSPSVNRWGGEAADLADGRFPSSLFVGEPGSGRIVASGVDQQGGRGRGLPLLLQHAPSPDDIVPDAGVLAHVLDPHPQPSHSCSDSDLLQPHAARTCPPSPSIHHGGPQQPHLGRGPLLARVDAVGMGPPGLHGVLLDLVLDQMQQLDPDLDPGFGQMYQDPYPLDPGILGVSYLPPPPPLLTSASYLPPPSPHLTSASGHSSLSLRPPSPGSGPFGPRSRGEEGEGPRRATASLGEECEGPRRATASLPQVYGSSMGMALMAELEVQSLQVQGLHQGGGHGQVGGSSPPASSGYIGSGSWQGPADPARPDRGAPAPAPAPAPPVRAVPTTILSIPCPPPLPTLSSRRYAYAATPGVGEAVAVGGVEGASWLDVGCSIVGSSAINGAFLATPLSAYPKVRVSASGSGSGSGSLSGSGPGPMPVFLTTSPLSKPSGPVGSGTLPSGPAATAGARRGRQGPQGQGLLSAAAAAGAAGGGLALALAAYPGYRSSTSTLCCSGGPARFAPRARTWPPSCPHTCSRACPHPSAWQAAVAAGAVAACSLAGPWARAVGGAGPGRGGLTQSAHQPQPATR